MTKNNGEINSILEAKELVDKYISDLFAEVADKESSLLSKEELKVVYLDAAEQVGQAERQIKEMRFTEFEGHGIKHMREVFRNMRKFYIAYANGQKTKANKFYIGYQKASQKYIELRRIQMGEPNNENTKMD